MLATAMAVERLEQVTLQLWDKAESFVGSLFGPQLANDIASILQEPLDVSKWDWSALDPRNAGSFEWKYGVTPFSNWQVIVAAWVLYFGTIIFIRVCWDGSGAVGFAHRAMAHARSSRSVAHPRALR